MGQVNIQDISLKEAVAQAKATDKKVMIIVCATWCGPCQMLARDVFPTEEAGDYINERLVVVKYNVDVADPENLVRDHHVSALPTFIFIDGNGEEYSRYVGGSRGIQDFIAKTENALKLENSWAYMDAKLVSVSYVPEYIKYANDVGRPDKARDALYKYFDSKSLDEKFSNENMELYNSNIRNTESLIIVYMLNHRREVSGVMGEKEYTDFIAAISNRQLSSILRRLDTDAPETFDNLRKDLDRIDLNPLYKTAFSDLVENNFDNIRQKNYAGLSDNSINLMSGLDTQNMTEFVYLNVHLPITFKDHATLTPEERQARRKMLVELHETAVRYETDPGRLNYYRSCLAEYKKSYEANKAQEN